MNSIRSRLTLGLLVSAAVLLGLGGGFVYLLMQSYFYREVDERLRVQALSITSVVKQEKEYIDVDFSDRYLPEFGEQEPKKFYQIWAPLPIGDRDKKKSDSLKRGQDLPREVGTMAEPHYWSITLPNGRPGRAIGLRYVPHADRHDRKRNFDPELYIDLVVAEDAGEVLEGLATIRRSLWLVGGLGFLVAAILIRVIVRRELHALNFVGDKAGSISADTLHLRFPEEAMPREMKPICTRLNQLLSRLESSFERERQFSSDIAHELRTPIAELRSYAELNLKWPDQPTGKFPADALKIALQMESLVENLMLLARCDQEQLPVNREPFNLSVTVREAVDLATPKAARRDLKLTSRCLDDLVLHSDRTLVVSILNNLVGNAVEYSPPGTEVIIVCERNGPDFQVSVSNAAPNLRPEDEVRLFDRFWRSDPARSAHEHFGLGLPLSRALAVRLGCQLVSRLENERLTISLSGQLD